MLTLAPQTAMAGSTQTKSVSCTFESLSIEDREIAMVLMFVRYSDRGEDRISWRRGLDVAGRMLDAANTRCKIAHHWSRGQATHARDYAFNSLLVEAMRQMLESEGTRSAEPIDRYFALHGSELLPRQDTASRQGTEFTTYLIKHGWDADGEDDLRQARNYLEALIGRQGSVRGFQASVRVKAG